MKPCTCSGPLLALAVLLTLASSSRAGLLPVNFQPGAPTITGSNGSLAYTASTGNFHTTVSTLTYNAPFVLPRGFAILSGSPQLVLDLFVDQSGNFVDNGTGLALTGSVTINGASFGGAGNPLLTGMIVNFGSQPAGPPTVTFDGYYLVTGGDLTKTKTGTGGAQVFGGFSVGNNGGFILSVENVTGGTLGDFTHNFSSSSVKPNPVGVLVPEPGSLALLLTAAGALGGWAAARARLFWARR